MNEMTAVTGTSFLFLLIFVVIGKKNDVPAKIVQLSAFFALKKNKREKRLFMLSGSMVVRNEGKKNKSIWTNYSFYDAFKSQQERENSLKRLSMENQIEIRSSSCVFCPAQPT